jgi:hypothetical protein
MVTLKRHVKRCPRFLTLLLSFPLTAVAHIAVLNAVDNGLGADGEVIEVLLDVQRQRSNLDAYRIGVVNDVDQVISKI